MKQNTGFNIEGKIMIVNVERLNGLCKLQIEGEMTVITAAELKKELLKNLKDCSDIEMDLSRVCEMDTSGFQLLLLIHRETMLANKQLRVASYSPAILSVLELYGMNREDF